MEQPVTLDELGALLHAVDKKRGGCTVTLYTLNVPSQRGGYAMHALVEHGMSESKVIAHDESELLSTMRSLAK